MAFSPTIFLNLPKHSSSFLHLIFYFPEIFGRKSRIPKGMNREEASSSRAIQLRKAISTEIKALA